MKLVHDVPRSTFTYLVEGFLGKDHTSLRNQILSRYPSFYRKLKMSPSKEVRMLVNMISSDPRSTTCQNLRYLRKVIKLEDPEQFSSWRIKEELPKQDVPQAEQWRLGLMTRLMHMKQNLYMEVQDSQKITAMLDSLCST